MKRTTSFRFLLLSTLLVTVGSAVAQTVYQWNGTTDTTFGTSSNWSPTGGGITAGPPPTGGTTASRINVNNSNAARALTYTATQGTTIFNGTDRALVIGSGVGVGGTMFITGGTFDSRSTGNDLVGHNGGTGALTVNGTGTYTRLSAANTTFFIGLNGGSGLSTVSTGTLTIAGSGNFSAGTLQFGAGDFASTQGTIVSTVNLDGGTLSVSSLTENLNVDNTKVTSTVNFNGGTLQARADQLNFIGASVTNAVVQGNGAIIDTQNFNVTIDKALTAGSGSGGLTKQGGGTLNLNVANSYTGVTNVNVGTLGIGNNTALGTTAGNTIVASGATVYGVAPLSALAEAFNISGTGVGGNGALRFGGGGTTNVTGAVTLGGNARIQTDGGVTLTMSGGIDTAGNALTLAPTGTAFNITTLGISGTNGSVITSGTVSLNVASSYGGGTTVNSGTLNIGNATALGLTSGQLTVNGGTLNMAGNNVTVGNLTGAGGIISGTSGTRTLTIGQGNTGGGNFQGQINNGAGGTTGLTKTGNGTITLSGINSYSGATIVNGGKLTIASSGTINSTSGISIGAGEFNYNSSTALSQGVSFNGTGGTLSGSGTISSAFNVTTGNTLAIGNSVGVMNFGGDLTVGGTYLFELDNTLNTADLGDVAGNLVLGGILDLVQLGTYALGDKFTLFAYDGSLTGLFKDFGGVTNILDDTTFTDAGGIWRLNYNDTTAGLNGGFSASNTYATITSIPEPSAALLGGLGMLLLLRRRR